MKKLLLLLFTLLFAVMNGWAQTLNVDDDFNSGTSGWGTTHFATIQAAIDVASGGETIIVAAGTYVENVIVNKSLEFRGANYGIAANDPSDPTLVNPARVGESLLNGTFNLQVSNITIDGFAITGPGFAVQAAGTGQSNIALRNNNMYSNTGGRTIEYWLPAQDATAWTLTDNRIMDVQAADATAITLFNITGLTISNNTILHTNAGFNGRRGLNLDGCRNVTMSGNYVNLGLVNPASDNSDGAFTKARYPLQLSASYRSVTNVTVSTNNFGGAYDGVVTLGNGVYENITFSLNVLSNVVLGLRFQAGTNAPAGSLTDIFVTDNSIFSSNRCIYLTDVDPYTNVDINNNVLIRNMAGAVLEVAATAVITDLPVDATCNWWGSADPSIIAAKISGPVDWSPFWTSSNGGTCNGVAPFTNSTTGLSYATLQAALNAATNGQTVTVNVAGTYGGITFSTGQSVALTNTSGGTVTFTGASPALTVTSGTLTVSGMSYTTPTNDPTILIDGGTLNISDCSISSSTGFDNAGIRITSGTLNAGTSSVHGENTFIYNSSGDKAIDNQTATACNAIGNYWGSIIYPEFIVRLSGPVNFDPWCNSTFTVCNYSLLTPGPITYASKLLRQAGTVVVPITVKDFDNVMGISLKLGYETGLTYMGIAPGPAPVPSLGWSFFHDETNKKIVIAYQATTGFNLADNAVLLNVTFSYDGGLLRDLTWIEEDPTGTDLEYTNSVIQAPYYDIPNTTYYKAGYVTSGYLTFERNYPNPLAYPLTPTNQEIGVTLTGGTGTITYEWVGPNGKDSGDDPDYAEQYMNPDDGYGPYTVTVTDGNGATLSGSYYFGPVHNIDSELDYATIQSANDATETDPLDRILVDPGTYAEQVVITKALDLRGPFYGVSGYDVLRGTTSEATIRFPSSMTPNAITEEDDVVKITADNVTIEGFTVDGQHYDPSGYYQAMGIMSQADNSIIRNNRVLNSETINILVSSYYWNGSTWATDFRDGVIIQDNYVGNPGIFDRPGMVYGYGIYVQGTYGDVLANLVEDCRSGIQVQPYNHPNGTSDVGTVSGNSFEGYRTGMYFNYSENTNGSWQFLNNTVTGIAPPTGYTITEWTGVAVETYNGGLVNFSDNSITFGGAVATSKYTIKNYSTLTFTATCNWHGSDYAGDVLAWISGILDPTPFLTSGVETVAGQALIGFYPAANCTGGPVKVYTNSAMTDLVATYITIQDGVDGALAAYYLFAEAGSYPEMVEVDKALTLRGPNYLLSGNDPLRTAEAIVRFPSSFTPDPIREEDDIILVTADNVVVEGFTLDGQDYDPVGAYQAVGIMSEADNTVIRNNRVINSETANIWVSCYYWNGSTWAIDYRSGIVIQNNYAASPVNFDECYLGIYIQGAYGTVTGNVVEDVQTGIQVQPYSLPAGSGTVSGNSFEAYRDAIWFNGGGMGTSTGAWSIAENTLTGIEPPSGPIAIWDGIRVNDSGQGAVSFTANTINPGSISATNTHGIRFGAAGTVLNNKTIANNFITGTDYGIYLVSGLLGIEKIFVNENDLAGNLLYAVYNGSSDVDLLNATCNWYGIITVAGVAAEINGLVDYDPWLVDGTDNEPGTIGFQPVPGSCTGATNLYVNDLVSDNGTNDIYTYAIGNDANPGTDLLPFLTITKAVNTAMEGTSIWVDAGTFQEQVLIGKTIDITGVDETKTIITAPVTMTSVTWNNAHPIMYAHDATVNITQIAINGNPGNSDSWFIGMLYYNASGTFDNNTITGIHDAAGYTGSQSGHAFYGVNAGATAQSLTVTNNIISDYQKGGIYIKGVGTTANVGFNWIVGQDVPLVNAQNGVVMRDGAAGLVQNNVILYNYYRNHRVSPPAGWWESCGIMLYYAGAVNVYSNALDRNEIGIYSEGSTGETFGSNNYINNNIHVWQEVGPVLANNYDKTVLNPAQDYIVYGCIQYGVDFATSGNTLNASAGTFVENVEVHTAVTLNGPNANVDPTVVTPSRVAEAIVMPAVNDAVNGRVFNVTADNVTINGFLVDGDNPGLSGGIFYNGADINTQFGIGSGTWSSGTGGKNGMIVKYNIVKNFNDGGIYGNGGGTPVENGLFTYNWVDNSPWWGIIMETNCYTDVTYNKITNVTRGIQYDNYYNASTGGTTYIEHNNITYHKRGILQNLHYTNGSPYIIRNNTLTASATTETANVGILYWSQAVGITALAYNNTINANEHGIRVWNCQGIVTLDSNTVNGGQYGIVATNNDAYGLGSVSGTLFTRNIINSPSVAGFWLEDFDGTGVKTIAATATYNYFNGGANAVKFTGNDITAVVNENSITGQTGMGVDITGYTGSALQSFTCNWWGAPGFAAVAAAVGASNPPVDYAPWLINGTDNQLAIKGFQPVPGSCNGIPSITGTLKYYHPNTPANMNGVVLELSKSGFTTIPATVQTDGSYTFANEAIVNGTYTLSVLSNPKGPGSINATDAALANYWGTVHPYAIEYVRFLAGDVAGLDYSINATDANGIQLYFVNPAGNPFDRSTWSYWKTNDYVTGDVTKDPIQVTVSNANVTQNLYGQVTGDFNMSYNWNLFKATAANVMLTYGGQKQIGANAEAELPLRMVNAAELSAVSLILNYPADLMEVLDVTMKDNNGKLDWATYGNELRIGWNSSVPMTFAAAEELLVIRLKTTENFIQGNTIRFEVVADPMNELADAKLSTIPDAELNIDLLESSALGIGDQTLPTSLSMTAYPNPFGNYTIIRYELPSEGHVTLEISNMFGLRVATIVDQVQSGGSYTYKIDALPLAPGVYMATIRVQNDSNDMIRTIKLIRNN